MQCSRMRTRERLHAAQHEVAVERRRHRAHRVLQEPQLVGQLGVVRRATKPPTTSEWPPRYFVRRVHDCVGAERERLLQVRRGERVVDDDTRAARVREPRRPRRCRRSSSSGFVGVSIHTMPCLAAATRPRARPDRARSHAVQRCRGVRARAATSRNVPPYASFGMITWSPGSSVRRIASSAASPLANAEPVARAFERRDARLHRGARRVGAARVLVAAVLARPRPARTWSRGVIGGTTAPVCGSGSWPAWMARVSNPSPRSCLGAAREEPEHVGAGQHADRMTAVEHEHRRARSRHSTTRATGSPMPIIGIGRAHHVGDRPVEHRRRRGTRGP